ncbi:MAG: M1 family metallopeptidase [Candidatus Kryptoniota bacterium]
MKKSTLLFLFLSFSFTGSSTTILFAQEPSHYNWGSFTRADSLRGYLSPLRTCYDVTYYHLDISINPDSQSIQGSNTIRFKVVNAFNKMQVDLFANMNVDSIILEDGTILKYSREFGAVFINMPRELEQNTEHQIVFYYSGRPQVAKNPPWDGGFIWKKDKSRSLLSQKEYAGSRKAGQGNPWVMVTCQGTGASLWWPNKDHQSAEPDSMLLSVTIPKGLEDISNGRLRSEVELPGGRTQYNWFISYPINNYDVTVNIGRYAHFNDTYRSRDGSKLTLDYYVMQENLQKAKKQFKQVKTMLACYEKYFGKYPFYRDGYKLIESSHNGMEHQSAIAYGNHYQLGYEGRASSTVGLKFDFIIVHESAHEWWGNSITSKDVADMWIHESFAAYAEALYAEYNWGHKAALEYINAKKQNVRNDEPIIGPYNVNHEGAGDMYDKGQLVLNTLRDVIANDKLWFSILKGFQEKYAYQTVDADDIIDYINQHTGTDYNYFFEQYLRYPALPQLTVFVTKKGDSTALRFKWDASMKDFKMPIKVTTSKNRFEFIHPTTEWQTMKLVKFDPKDFKVDEDEFFCKVKINRYYIDPRSDIKIF